MHIKNKDITKLQSLLHTSTPDGKATVLLALAKAIVYDSGLLRPSSLGIDIKEITNELCELAILDRVKLEKTIYKVYNHFNIKDALAQHRISKAYPDSAEAAFCVTETMTPSDYEVINNNIELFNTIVRLFNKNKAHIIDED